MSERKHDRIQVLVSEVCPEQALDRCLLGFTACGRGGVWRLALLCMGEAIPTGKDAVTWLRLPGKGVVGAAGMRSVYRGAAAIT